MDLMECHLTGRRPRQEEEEDSADDRRDEASCMDVFSCGVTMLVLKRRRKKKKMKMAWQRYGGDRGEQ